MKIWRCPKSWGVSPIQVMDDHDCLLKPIVTRGSPTPMARVSPRNPCGHDILRSVCNLGEYSCLRIPVVKATAVCRHRRCHLGVSTLFPTGWDDDPDSSSGNQIIQQTIPTFGSKVLYQPAKLQYFTNRQKRQSGRATPKPNTTVLPCDIAMRSSRNMDRYTPWTWTNPNIPFTIHEHAYNPHGG